MAIDKDKTKGKEDRKLAVLFPGIGYSFDRPLLHFGEKQAQQYGYEILRVAYSGFPGKIRGNKERMRESYDIAMKQTEEILGGVQWAYYSRILFISKSIGTVVAAHYAAEHEMAVDHIFFTPFPETFAARQQGRCIAFHARTDPWMDDAETVRAAEHAGAEMICYPEGNHSLETGDVLRDIRTLEEIFQRTADFMH
jgi:hypothetical protein